MPMKTIIFILNIGQICQLISVLLNFNKREFNIAEFNYVS